MNKDKLKSGLQRYETIVSNIEWHIRTNTPPEMEVKELESQLDIYGEFISLLKSLQSSQHQSQVSMNEVADLMSELEKFAQKTYGDKDCLSIVEMNVLDDYIRYKAQSQVSDGWVSVEDRQPKENGYYIVWCINPNEYGLIHYHESTGWQNGFYNDRVTHYQKPNPPINQPK